MTEHRTPDHIFESSPRSFGVGSKIGYHLTNAAGRLSGLDARQTREVSQAPNCKKLALNLQGVQSKGLVRWRGRVALAFLPKQKAAYAAS